MVGAGLAGRVPTVGAAVAGFLPTAGIGASNAMRAAAGLADELSRADAAIVPLALELYQKRCRHVIERNQADSRRLARVMFVRHPPLAWARPTRAALPGRTCARPDHQQRVAAILTQPKTRRCRAAGGSPGASGITSQDVSISDRQPMPGSTPEPPICLAR